MFNSRSANFMMIFLAVLALVLTGLPGIVRAAAPAGITPTPTNTVPPPTDTPTNTPPGPTQTPTNTPPGPTETPTLPPTETPTPTDGTVVPPPPSATPTIPTTEEPTEPPPKAPRNTDTPEPPLLPETGQLPPDGGNDGPGSPRQLILLLLAFLGALVIGFAGGKRVRNWLASLGVLGTILILLLLSAGLALWSNGIPTAAAGNPGGTYSEAPLQAEEQAFSLAKGAASISGFVDRAERSTAGQPAGAQAQASSSAVLAAVAALRTERDDSAAQRLRIPFLKVDAQVVPVPFDGRTWDVNEIAAEVAWLGGTSQPGLGGNTVLAGHITAREIGNGPFRYLNWLSPGEEIFVYTDQKIYLYRVREFRIVEARDGAVTAATENPQLTLVTCSAWDEQVESYVKRRVVYADLVRVISLNVSRPIFGAQ
jgi:LPXTG-site transpeptidase (sortase) family protein